MVNAEIIVKGYEVKDQIKRTQCSHVYSALKEGREYVIKTGVDSSRISKKLISNETDILKILGNKSSNIVEYVEDFEVEDERFILFEKIIGKDADDFEFGDEKTRIIFGLYVIDQVCNPLRYMHKRIHPYKDNRSSIAHGDISPKNIIVTKDYEVKLIDFALADFCTIPKMFDDEFDCSNPGYTSPERFDSNITTRESDIFALGGCLFSLITGKDPFRYKNEDFEDVVKRIKKENPSPRKHNKSISRSLESLIKACIDKNPRKRPTINKLKRGILSLL